jgi:hypothetical protein
VPLVSVDDSGRVSLPEREGARPDSSLPAVLTRLAARLDELDAAPLTVAGGDTVQIVCLSEVEEWLLGQASRARAGVPL